MVDFVILARALAGLAGFSNGRSEEKGESCNGIANETSTELVDSRSILEKFSLEKSIEARIGSEKTSEPMIAMTGQSYKGKLIYSTGTGLFIRQLMILQYSLPSDTKLDR